MYRWKCIFSWLFSTSLSVLCYLTPAPLKHQKGELHCLSQQFTSAKKHKKQCAASWPSLLSRLVLQTKIKRKAVQGLKLEDTEASNLRTYIWLCTPKQNSQQLGHTLNKIIPSFSLLLIDFIPHGYYKHCSWRIRSLMQKRFCQETQIPITLVINIFTEY